MTKRIRISLVSLLLLLAGLLPVASAGAQEQLCFPEVAPVIRDCIKGRFLEFWRQNGGLPVFGYPITAEFSERNRDTGQTYTVQYFERQRFEFHPEHQRPFDVLLGRLGAEWLDKAMREDGFNPGEKNDPSEPHYAPETGYRIGFDPWYLHPEGEWYWQYWSSHGLEYEGSPNTKTWGESLMLFGYPLSRVLSRAEADGPSEQVYERTILRYQPHAKHDPEWRIVPDRIGVWYYKFIMKADRENRLVYP